MNKLLRVKCPQCETVFSYYESEYRPFCTERCKLVDLGHWFEETYRVPEKNKNPINQESGEIEKYESDQENSQENYQENYQESYQENYEENYEEDYDENDYK